MSPIFSCVLHRFRASKNSASATTRKTRVVRKIRIPVINFLPDRRRYGRLIRTRPKRSGNESRRCRVRRTGFGGVKKSNNPEADAYAKRSGRPPPSQTIYGAQEAANSCEK